MTNRVEHVSGSSNVADIFSRITHSAAQRRRQGGRGSPIDMLGPPINKVALLKTAAFVLYFKLWPPLINAWPP